MEAEVKGGQFHLRKEAGIRKDFLEEVASPCGLSNMTVTQEEGREPYGESRWRAIKVLVSQNRK